MNLKIAFLVGLFPKETIKEIEEKSSGPIQYAADALQWSIVRGLDEHLKHLTLVNLLYVGSFPQRYKDLIIKSYPFSHDGVSKDYNVGFINLMLYKLYSRYYRGKIFLKANIVIHNDVLLIYAIHIPFLLSAIHARKKNPNLKICLIVPDIPEFMGNNNFVRRCFSFIEDRVLKNCLNQIDSFVLLSKYMANYLHIEHKPWDVMEGIFDTIDDALPQKKEKNITILYSGTLAKRYGIKNLLQSFSEIYDINYRLWIFGDGDGRVDVEIAAKNDNRIIYFGQKSRKEILEYQKRATILVNPRTAEGEYTKYSFPSKIMEYLASGTPTIMYKLEGIPEEYFKYCFISENNSVSDLKNKIVEVANLSEAEREKIGLLARNFILENKNAKVQTQKIINLINQ